MSTTTTVPEALIARLRRGSRYLVTSHVNPDGDAIGTAVGLARLLTGIGKSVTIWSRDPVPPLYRPLPGTDRIHIGDEPPAGFPDAFDTAIVLECPTLDRSGLERHLEGLSKVNIDHHLGNQHYGEANWVDPTSPAVGEMIFRMARAMRLEIDSEAATALFLALSTDTGGFRFGNASVAAFQAAAGMVEAGARPERVARWLHESRTEAAVRLIGELLETLELHHDGTIATALLTREMLERTGAEPGDSEGLIDYPRSIGGVLAVALLREIDEGEVKVSLRSSGDLDVDRIARRHDGGGHPNAAGLRMRGQIEQARRRIVAELAAEMRGEER
jgi:phosphoesterase RecJ-like protein